MEEKIRDVIRMRETQVDAQRALWIQLETQQLYLKVNRVQHLFRCVQLQEEHYEDTMIRQLLEVGSTYFLILQQDSSHNSQNLAQANRIINMRRDASYANPKW